MRIFNSLTEQISITRKTGWWLSNRQATIVSRKFKTVLELNEFQFIQVIKYLQGDDINLEMLMSPREASSISEFVSWYNCEYTTTRPQSVAYITTNLNTGASIVFVHRGFETEESVFKEE